MIHKIKELLHLSGSRRCSICGDKYEKTNLSKFELSDKENSIFRLLKSIDDRYLRFLSNRVYMCDKCQSKFEDIRKRINNALEDESPIELHYETIPIAGAKKIWSGWYKSKDACEDDLKTLARFYKIKEVYAIECEMSEVEESFDFRTSTSDLPKSLQKLMTPTEYIYRLNGYIFGQNLS